LIVQLIQVNHHVFVLFTLILSVFFIRLVLLVRIFASLLSLVARPLLLLLLKFHELLGDIDIQLLFFVVIILRMMLAAHNFGLLLLKEAGCPCTTILMLLHLLFKLLLKFHTLQNSS
jgi:hypothetical protein